MHWHTCTYTQHQALSNPANLGESAQGAAADIGRRGTKAKHFSLFCYLPGLPLPHTLISSFLYIITPLKTNPNYIFINNSLQHGNGWVSVAHGTGLYGQEENWNPVVCPQVCVCGSDKPCLFKSVMLWLARSSWRIIPSISVTMISSLALKMLVFSTLPSLPI